MGRRIRPLPEGRGPLGLRQTILNAARTSAGAVRNKAGFSVISFMPV